MSRLQLAHSEPSENSGTVRDMLPISSRAYTHPYKTMIVNKDRADVPQERVWGNQIGLPTDFGISLNFLSQTTPHSSTTTPKMLYMHQKGKKRWISYREQGLLAGNKFDICHGSPWKMLSAGDYMTHRANNMHIIPI